MPHLRMMPLWGRDVNFGPCFSDPLASVMSLSTTLPDTSRPLMSYTISPDLKHGTSHPPSLASRESEAALSICLLFQS
jgi:hypothetical protein